MQLVSLRIRNFRSIEDLSLSFRGLYTAICGANDSGKTNIVRAIRALTNESLYPAILFEEESTNYERDYPKWLEGTSSPIEIEAAFHIAKDRDAAFHEFCVRILKLEQDTSIDDSLTINVKLTHASDSRSSAITISVGSNKYTGIEAEEVLNRLKSSGTVVFHNSTQRDFGYRFRGDLGPLSEFTKDSSDILTGIKEHTRKGLKKIAKGQQLEFEHLLGRLEKKYKVSISLPEYDLSQIPFNMTLGDSDVTVGLDDWGSGTQNRTRILLALFRAKQAAESPTSALKTTPLLVIEEPECFLHPSAQSEFGRVIQDLAVEFGVQVIVTTHSPYLLSRDIEQNILLHRIEKRKKLRETCIRPTNGEDWMLPYAHALGLISDEFKNWIGPLISTTSNVLLVEGETDKEYFELLRDASHGVNRLDFDGDVVAYQGIGNIKNTVLMKFIKNLVRRLFLTYDLDVEHEVHGVIHALQMEKGVDYTPIGVNSPGKKCIEGMLPDHIYATVSGRNPALVRELSSGSKDEQKDARQRMKQLCLAEFKNTAKPGDDYKSFYGIVKIINKAFKHA